MSFPDDVAGAYLGLGIDLGNYINTPVYESVYPDFLSSGNTVSVEIASGYYDLGIILFKTDAAGDPFLYAGAAEKVHIYSGLESAAEYRFTNEDFGQIVPEVPVTGALEKAPDYVTVQDFLPGRLIFSWEPVSGAAEYNVYRSTSGNFYTGDTIIVTLNDVSSYTNTQTYTDTGVTPGITYYYKVAGLNPYGEGPHSAVISITPASTGSVTTLIHNVWTRGAEISSPGEVDWYEFTDSGAGGAYCIQWDDMNGDPVNYTGDIMVSAYRADGTPEYLGAEDSRYINLVFVNIAPGETIYVKTEGRNQSTGTYALRYYQ